MSKPKKPKNPKKAQPAEEKAAEKELLNYEPLPVEAEEAKGLQFRYSIRGEGEEREREIYITVPNEPGATWEKSKTRAFRYYDALRRAEEWVEKEGVVDDLIEGDRANSWQHARAINKYAAGIITNNYLRVYMARALDDEAEAEYLQELSDALEVKDADDLVDRLFRTAELVADTVAESWAELESGPGSLPETAREYYSSHAANLAAAAILRAEEEREENSETDWAEAFHRHLDEVTEERAHLLALEHGNSIARSTLEEHQPVSMPLEKLRISLGLDLLLQNALEGKAGQASTLRIPTGQLMRHMYGHVSSPELSTLTDLTLRRDGARIKVRARSSTNLQATLASPPGELLEKMHQSILSVKRHGAALLKTQLDLMNQAYTAGGATPLFHYNLAEALERQGYAQRDARGYASVTMQGLRERLATLAHQQIDVLNLTETDKKGRTRHYIDSTPYWIIESTRRRTEGDDVNAAIVLLTDPNAPVITGFTMRPGLWWQAVGVGDFYLDIPAAVLELPTYAKSNEPERLALQLTPLLAIWERSSQAQHAGKSTCYAAGTLLSEAGYTTRDDFMTMHPTKAKRMRDYLASTDGTGAIPILNRLGAFSLEIEDEADFFASNRGWRERFWDTQVRLNIRDMQLPKKRALSRRRSRS